jgi:hypothetical protein
VILTPPMFISGRLMAAVKVGDDATLHIQPDHLADEDSLIVWRYVIDYPGGSYENTDLRTPWAPPDDLQAPRLAMSTLCVCLPHFDGDTDLPPELTAWAKAHEDELTDLAFNLDEEDDDDD